MLHHHTPRSNANKGTSSNHGSESCVLGSSWVESTQTLGPTSHKLLAFDVGILDSRIVIVCGGHFWFGQRRLILL